MFKDPVEGKVLPGHVIGTEKVANVGSCRKKCFLEPNCESINVGPADHQGQRTCELNNFRDESPSQTKLQEKTGHIHCSIEVTHYNNINNDMTYNFKTPHEKATKITQNNGEVISNIWAYLD